MSNKTDNIKKLSKKKKIVLIIVLLLILFGVFRIVTNRLEDTTVTTSDVINIKVTTSAITTLENTSPLTGRLEPIEEVALLPKAMGEVTNVYVDLGQKVKKGTVLFELDKTQMATSFNQAKAGYQDAQTNLSRMQTLYQEGAVSLQQYEQAKTAYTIAKESYTAASDGLSNYVVSSPIDGYVTSVNIDVGTLASQAVAAVTVANIDELEINTSVSENMINKVAVGDKVEVLVSSVSDTPLPGTISALSPAPAAGTLTYPMKITLDNENTLMKPGMFAEVIITSDRTYGVIALPSASVLIKSGKTVVAVIEDNKLVFRDVVVGVDNGELAEIKSGIEAGDTVVIEGQYYLEENSEFNIIE
ncbi:MAG: efflux RND transporter periplasmic adaptor subunit [Eubacteriales bacterium]|nr:efflux RND transporter periplasmic adaptor subunit [Eubacteriales bacterium]